MFLSTFYCFFQQFGTKTSKNLAFYQQKPTHRNKMKKTQTQPHKQKSSYHDNIVGTFVNCAMDYSCTPKILYALPAR